jgi:peroxiredoxin Q/BCP
MNKRVLSGFAALLLMVTCASLAKVTVGQKAPDFSLVDESGTTRTLSDMHGKKIVLYFYPKDGTPGCTEQACSLRDGYSVLKRAGIEIWGISYDSPAKHKEFKDKHHLPFTLLSDEHKEVAALYNAKGWFGLPKRVTYLINEQGIIIKALEDIDVSGHADQIMLAFKN